MVAAGGYRTSPAVPAHRSACLPLSFRWHAAPAPASAAPAPGRPRCGTFVDPVPGAVTRSGQVLLDVVFRSAVHAALTATAGRTGRPLSLFVQGSVHRAGPGPVCRRGGRPPRPGSAAPARRHHPTSHGVVNPTDEQRAAADAFHAGKCLALQAGAGTGKSPPRPRRPGSTRCPAWQSGQVPGIAKAVRIRERDLSQKTLSNVILRTVACFCRTADTTITRTTSRARAAGSHEPARRTRGLQRAVRPQSPGRAAAPDEDGTDRGSAVM